MYVCMYVCMLMPHVLTHFAPPDPPRVPPPPPPSAPPPSSPPPPPPHALPRGGDVMDSFIALAMPLEEEAPTRGREDAGGAGSTEGQSVAGGLHSIHSTADSSWDALEDTAPSALPPPSVPPPRDAHPASSATAATPSGEIERGGGRERAPLSSAHSAAPPTTPLRASTEAPAPAASAQPHATMSAGAPGMYSSTGGGGAATCGACLWGGHCMHRMAAAQDTRRGGR